LLGGGAAAKAAAAGTATALAAAPAPPKPSRPGDITWKRQPDWGPYWEGENQLDPEWCIILGQVVCGSNSSNNNNNAGDSMAPSTGRYARALVKSMLQFLEARTTLADASVLTLLEQGAWDKASLLVRSSPAAAQAWGLQAGESQGLSPLHVAIRRGAPADLVRLLISANPEAPKERPRNGTHSACLPLWQAARDFELGPKRRSTEAPRSAALAVVREVFIGHPLAANEPGPDKARPLDDVSPKFLFDRRVCECLASLQCPRLAAQTFGGCIALEAVLELEDVKVEDVTRLVWVSNFPCAPSSH
jgi:hypothetical protein